MSSKTPSKVNTHCSLAAKKIMSNSWIIAVFIWQAGGSHTHSSELRRPMWKWDNKWNSENSLREVPGFWLPYCEDPIISVCCLSSRSFTHNSPVRPAEAPKLVTRLMNMTCWHMRLRLRDSVCNVKVYDRVYHINTTGKIRRKSCSKTNRLPSHITHLRKKESFCENEKEDR